MSRLNLVTMSKLFIWFLGSWEERLTNTGKIVWYASTGLISTLNWNRWSLGSWHVWILPLFTSTMIMHMVVITIIPSFIQIQWAWFSPTHIAPNNLGSWASKNKSIYCSYIQWTSTWERKQTALVPILKHSPSWGACQFSKSLSSALSRSSMWPNSTNSDQPAFHR